MLLRYAMIAFDYCRCHAEIRFSKMFRLMMSPLRFIDIIFLPPLPQITATLIFR